MTMVIALPDYLAKRLSQQAAVHGRSAEALVIQYLEAALEVEPSLPLDRSDADDLDSVVQRIQALPINPVAVFAVQSDLARLLQEQDAAVLYDPREIAQSTAEIDAAIAEVESIS